MWVNCENYYVSNEIYDKYKYIFRDLFINHYRESPEIAHQESRKRKAYSDNSSETFFTIKKYAELEFENEDGISFVKELLNSLDHSNIFMACSILLTLKLKDKQNVDRILQK